MSNVSRLRWPIVVPTWRAAARPPAGPDNSRFTARRRACAAPIVPPDDCITTTGHGATDRDNFCRYRSTTGPNHALSQVAMPRSNSLYSGSTSDERQTNARSCRADLDRAFERVVHIAVEQIDRDRFRRERDDLSPQRFEIGSRSARRSRRPSVRSVRRCRCTTLPERGPDVARGASAYKSRRAWRPIRSTSVKPRFVT